MEVTNRFKGLDLVDSVWRSMDRGRLDCTGGGDKKPSPEKEMQTDKMVVWGGLTNSSEKKRRKGEGGKENISIWLLSSKEWQGGIRKPS